MIERAERAYEFAYENDLDDYLLWFDEMLRLQDLKISGDKHARSFAVEPSTSAIEKLSPAKPSQGGERNRRNEQNKNSTVLCLRRMRQRLEPRVEMSASESKKMIIKTIADKRNQAEECYRKAYAERVGMDAAANAWDDCNQNDGVGGFSTNPYTQRDYTKAEDDAKLAAAKWKEAYELAVAFFITDESRKDSNQ